MKYVVCFVVSTVALFPIVGSPLIISSKEAQSIGQKIWKNECAAKKEGLTSWNEGEAFASLGIGHFIWYPHTTNKVFKETFPSLLAFLEKKGKKIPAGILKNGSMACPWQTRQEFLNSISSKAMNDLRDFLADTIDLQTTFIIQRLHWALPVMLKSVSSEKHEQIKNQFYRVARSSGGFYALIDYINFKGEGTADNEQYKGCRWGLLQVLEMMQGNEVGMQALQDFSRCAQHVLETRIACAPKESDEKRWLPGWVNRLKTYTQ